jgi:ABC-2 type transport system permease protein
VNASLTSEFAGTGTLLRFFLRRDKVRIAVWAASMGAMYLYCMTALADVFGDTASQQARASLMRTPASIFMAGPGYGLDHYTLGPTMANELLLWFCIAVGIMSILQLVRHTRAEEESGRAELVRAADVGRHAGTLAALGTVFVANVVIAVVSFAALQVGSLPQVDNLAYVTSVALTGMVFAGVAAVTAQVTEHARTASGIAVAVVIASVFVRAAGDMRAVGGSLLSFFSPIGWAQQMRIYVDLRWWPMALSVASILVLLGISAWVATRRDFGAGVMTVKPGRADAHASLASPVALAWTQQRGSAIAWAVGFAIMFVASGTYLGGDTLESMVGDLVAQNPIVADVLNPQAIAASFGGIMLLMGAVCAMAYGISAVNRARTEESAGRAEVVLAAPVSRWRWIAAQLVPGVVVTALLMVLAAKGLWLGQATTGGTAVSFTQFVGTGLVYIPPILAVVGLAVAIYGWVPKLGAVPWIFVAWGLVAGMFGQAFSMPTWVLATNPLLMQHTTGQTGFYWLPNVILDGPHNWWGLIILTVLAIALFVLGAAGFRRRNVPAV